MNDNQSKRVTEMEKREKTMIDASH
jgi:hypothetical protein